MRTLKIYSLSKLQIYDAILITTVINMLYIRAPELTHLITIGGEGHVNGIIISQCMCVSNHRVVYTKHIHFCLSIVPQ